MFMKNIIQNSLLLFFIITSFVFSQEELSPSDSCTEKRELSPGLNIVSNDTKCKTQYSHSNIFKHKSKKKKAHFSKQKPALYRDSEKSIIFGYQGLIGAFIGSLMAALIAIGSIWKTHKNSTELFNKEKSQERERNERLYCGLLYIIAKELESNGKISELLLTDINSYQEFIKMHKELPSIDPFDKYSFDLLQEVVIKILSYDMYETSIIGLMSPYLLILKRVNHDLVLSRLTESDEAKKRGGYYDAVNSYLDDVKKKIGNISTASENIRVAIVNEIGKFPHSEIDLN